MCVLRGAVWGGECCMLKKEKALVCVTLTYLEGSKEILLKERGQLMLYSRRVSGKTVVYSNLEDTHYLIYLVRESQRTEF